ncbi:MAG TPA: class C sortase [Candidatus Gallacutalibacter pullistercoris]|nr:class C sortase [Candidatus Gallacutalibacter pullistercoris]
MKKKPRITTILIILLFLVGLGVLFYPTASDLYYRWQAKREIEAYNEAAGQIAEASGKDYSELWEAAEAYNRQLAQRGNAMMDVSEEEEAEIFNLLNPLGTGMMGSIEIPAIQVNIPIFQGTGEKALQSGAGFWLGTSLPTGGPSTHCVITAHNGLVKAKMFTDLDKLQIGDEFTLHILDRDLTYQVDQILVTEPEDTSQLQIIEGKDYVTLYTCTPYGVNTHRLLVRGVRVKDEGSTGMVDWNSMVLSGWLFGLLLFLLLLLLAGLFYWKRRKKSAQKGEEDHVPS